MRESYPNWWISSQLIVIIQSVKTGVSEFLGEKFYFSTGSIKNHSYTPEGSFNYYSRPSRANRIAFLNDVFQARMKTTNKGLLINDDFKEQLFSTGFLQLRPYGDTFNPKLLYYFIISPTFLNQRDDLATGSTQEALTDTKAVELSIPLPPLNEQKRIVTKLDTIIPRIDSLKARLDKIPALIKRFRQSVLTAAVTGKLTEKWRKKCKIDGEWVSNTLETVIKEGPQNGLYKSQDFYGNGVMILRIDNFYNGYLNSWNTLKRLELTTSEQRTYKLMNDDIVINRVNSMPFLGKSALVRSLEELCVFESNMMRIRVDTSKILPKFLIRYLNCQLGLDELRKNAKHAVNQSSINQQDVKAVIIPLPPLEEQTEIVRQVDKLFALADKLEAHYQNAKSSIDKLSQSVLAKAFRGELVPQDPNDEPAEKLLERIMAEKAKMESALKRGKKKGGAQKAKAEIRK